MGIGKEIQARFLSNFLNVITITIIFIFLILYYSTNKDSYTEFKILEIYKETINPNCTKPLENLKETLNKYGFYNTFCGGESIDDLNFAKYVLFIMFGSFIVCNEISNQIMINVSQKIDNISADGNDKTVKNKKYNITAILLIFIFLDFFTTTIKERFLALYKIFDTTPNKSKKKDMLTDILSSFLSILMTITILFIVINCGIYLTYIFYGLFISSSGRLSYLAILLGLPFLMSIAGVSLSAIEKFTNIEEFDNDIEEFDDDIEEFDDDIEEFDDEDEVESFENIIEGFKEGAKNKKKKSPLSGSSNKKNKAPLSSASSKKRKSKSSRAKRNKNKRKSIKKGASKFVKCKDYNYIWYILGFFVIPIFVSIYIIFNFFFTGLFKIFTISDSNNISKVKHILIISLILSAGIFCWILFEKLLNIYGIYYPKLMY
jgi:uncharacterized BrkB/YihY/UPF0761 family membrane protein